MAQKTFDLLKEREGKKASMNGATQIRAGVILPEVVIPLDAHHDVTQVKENTGGMQVGTILRIIREPNFGSVAKVVSLPEKPTIIATEAKVRVVEIEIISSGERVTLPRANVEIIEG